MFSHVRASFAALSFWALVAPAHAAEQPLVRVAAAASLQHIMPKLVESIGREVGVRVQASYGSSGNLARQIQQGAPFDLFLSADEVLPARLVETGFARKPGAVYAHGRLALYVHAASGIPVDRGLAELRDAWSKVGRFSIANPEHAPYGQAAREALGRVNLWELVRGRLVLGENVSQAAQYVATGAAQGGIVALSVALEPGFAKAGRHAVLPEHLHSPLRHRMVILTNARKEADAVFRFLLGPTARSALAAGGFGVPEGPSP